MEENYKGYQIRIEQDTDPDDPRGWSNLGTIVSWHRRDWIGDTTVGRRAHSTSTKCPYYFEDTEALRELLNSDNVVSVPVYLYQHSCSVLRCYPFGDPWDSGQVGYIFAEKPKIRECYGVKHVTQKLIEKVKQSLRDEVQTYSQYLNGEVYGFTISKDGEDVDGCYGYYDKDDCLKEAKGIVDHLVALDNEAAWAKVAMDPELV